MAISSLSCEFFFHLKDCGYKEVLDYFPSLAVTFCVASPLNDLQVIPDKCLQF